MKLFSKKLWILLVSIFTSDSLFAEENVNKISEQQAIGMVRGKIDEIVRSYVENDAFEGTILVSKSGRIIFKKAFGFADRAKNQQAKPGNSFQIASLSKPITATMVLMLKEQGKLKLDNTLADYFPPFNNKMGKKITLDHLLSHSSGIPNHFVIDGWFDPEFHNKTSEHKFVEIIAKLPQQFEPGTDYLYSNPGYFLLGKIIEKITGEAYSESIQKYVFAPLNMKRSGVAVGNQVAPGVIKGYRWSDSGGYREQATINMSLFGAGAAIFSNAEDLYNFDLALYDDKLLKEQSKKRMFNPERPYSWRVGSSPITPSNNVAVHEYNGQIEGFSSMMTRFVNERHSIILLSNVGMSYLLKQQLTFDIATVLFGQDVPSRKNDASLALIKSVVSGEFEQTLKELISDKLELNEQSLTSIAYQLLWSGLAEKSLQLFSFIRKNFSDSSIAQKNFLEACNHRLAKEVNSRSSICKGLL